MIGHLKKHSTGSGLKMPRGWQIVAFLFLLSICHCSANTRTKAHHFMSEDDLRRIFQVEHHNDVPEYEVVKIHSVRHSKRSSPDDVIHRVRLDTHGKRLQLELSQNRHLIRPDRPLDIWYADGGNKAESSNVTYIPGPEDTEHIGDVYQDESNQAAMLLYRDKTDDALLMDGTIGDDLVVKPLPSQIRSQISEGVLEYTEPIAEASYDNPFEVHEDFFSGDETRHTNETDDYEFLDEEDKLVDKDAKVGSLNNLGRRRGKREIRSDFHVVYRRKDSNFDHASDYHYMEMDQFPMKKSSQERTEDGEPILSRTKRQAPYIIFPEILCIIDYDGYRLHGKDNIAIKRYVISFWNGIDLRYKLLKHPSVKISIAGIIISRGRDATPYLERNRVGNDALDSASALTDMGKYLFLERRLPVYDIAVAITKLDMCRRKSRYGECNRGTAGFAYVGGACVVNKRLEKVNSVAIVEDTGGFSGIIVAAHELGHLLGAVHDGSPPPSYLGGPGAGKCRWEDGFIMSDLRHTSKGFRWSTCTISQFKHFLNGETATCMYNSPHETESLPRVLPGKLLTLDAQCRKDRGTSACFKDGRVCAQLFCFDAASGYCVSYRPAAEGSRCGDGQMCLNGKCVLEHENSVDYDGNRFLRKLGEVDEEDEYDGRDSPAEPSNTRKWWNQNQVKSSDKGSLEPITSPTTTTTKSDGQVCEDSATNIAGSMTCKTFLRSFAYQYCRHKYIRTNCCASHKEYCLNKRGGLRNGRSTVAASSASGQQQQRRRRQQQQQQQRRNQPDSSSTTTADDTS